MIFFYHCKGFGQKKNKINGKEKRLPTNLLCVWFIVRFTEPRPIIGQQEQKYGEREKI